MSILINDTQFNFLSGLVSGLRNYTGISPTGIGSGNYISKFTNGGSGIINSNLFQTGKYLGINTNNLSGILHISGGEGVGCNVFIESSSQLLVDSPTLNLVKVNAGQAGTINFINTTNSWTTPVFSIKCGGDGTNNFRFNDTNGDVFTIEDGSAAHNIYITNNKKIGIMNSNPQSTEDISGHLFVRGNITGNNIQLNNFTFTSGLVVSGGAPTGYNSPGYSGQIAISGRFLMVATGNGLWGQVLLSPW